MQYDVCSLWLGCEVHTDVFWCVWQGWSCRNMKLQMLAKETSVVLLSM